MYSGVRCNEKSVKQKHKGGGNKFNFTYWKKHTMLIISNKNINFLELFLGVYFYKTLFNFMKIVSLLNIDVIYRHVIYFWIFQCQMSSLNDIKCGIKFNVSEKNVAKLKI